MKLEELLSYDNIVIQCHDAPDADTIASGFALYTYFREKNKQVRLIYSGPWEAEKPNIVLMLQLLHIPLEYVLTQPQCELLVTVDCQYGSGNVQKWECRTCAVIDHHRISVGLPPLHEVRGTYGSCSTVVWSMLKESGFDCNKNPDVSTALYYGLYTDTAQFSEMHHPVDKDMRDSLKFRDMDFFELINTNITAQELEISTRALQNYRFDSKNKSALIPVEPCDSNILGIISDLAIQVDEIKVCVAYTENPSGCKFSVRSCCIDVRADDIAQYLCGEVGAGGGQRNKAGGFLSECLFEVHNGDRDYGKYLQKRMQEYFSEFHIIRSKDFKVNLQEMTRYRKKKIKLGVVCTADFLREGTPILIRTLEGDMECVSSQDLFIMIGIDGEVYPIRQEKFEHSYEFTDGKPEYVSEYEPTIHNTLTGEVYVLSPYMKTCQARGISHIYAKELEESVKIFTQWDEYKYLKGVKGDYIAVREDDFSDVYVIEKSIFLRSYERCE